MSAFRWFQNKIGIWLVNTGDLNFGASFTKTCLTLHCLTLLVINMICAYVQVLTLDNYLSLLQCFVLFISLNVTGRFWNIFNISCVDRAFWPCQCDWFDSFSAHLSSVGHLRMQCLVCASWVSSELLESLPKGSGSNIGISSVNATMYLLSVHLCVDACTARGEQDCTSQYWVIVFTVTFCKTHTK